MNKTISTFIFAAVLAIFAFSTTAAVACPGKPSCTKCGSSAEKHMEKKCEKGCTKPCCAKKVEKKCHKSKAKPSHEDSSRYND